MDARALLPQVEGWSPRIGPEESQAFCAALESGAIVQLPHTRFDLADDERAYLSPAWAREGAKNISLRPGATLARGALGGERDLERMGAMMSRYAMACEGLVDALMPRYREGRARGNTSFRPVAIGAARRSWRSDDRRLHVDAFASNPVHGRRILRVFSNVNPHGDAREWLVGEPFPAFAARFFPRVARPLPGAAALLQALGITKSRRTPYDHYMLGMHDAAKGDAAYQRAAPRCALGFAPGTTWIAFSDQVVHAATRGQYALEQTFYVEVGRLADRGTAPLAVLEKLAGRALAAL